MRPLLFVVLGIAGATTACALDEVDLAGKACPCADGWTCDDALNVCVALVVPDAGTRLDANVDARGRDAGPDSGRPDGSFDSGRPVDAGTMDTGAFDSGGSDSGRRDAGGDSGRLDAGPDAGPPPPDPTACDDVFSGAWFCDGFEDVGLMRWTTRIHVDGVTTRDTTRRYRGAGSLRAETTAPSGKASLVASGLPLITSGDVYLRGYVYVPSGQVVDTISLLYVGDSRPPYEGIAFQIVAGDVANLWVGPSGTGYPSTVVIPRDRWVCAQLHITLSNSAGVAEMWVDGRAAGRVTGIDTMPRVGLAEVKAGVEWASPAQTTALVFVDELVADTSPVACD